MPNDIRRFLQNRIRNLDILIDAEQKAIQNAPMGKISISRTHGYTQYRLLKDGSITYIRSSETELICSLAQKLYNEKIIKVASNERECLQKCLGTLGMIPEEVLDQMDNSFIPFIKPIILSDKDYIQQWVNSDYKRKDPPVASPFITKKGELVRSKSELLIADRLFDKGIPYRYEAELNLSGFVIHPTLRYLMSNIVARSIMSTSDSWMMSAMLTTASRVLISILGITYFWAIVSSLPWKQSSVLLTYP